MDERCWCGNRLGHAYESWVCGRCERPCCPSCAERDGVAATCVACHRAGPERLAA
jgi:hypothetical protein